MLYYISRLSISLAKTEFKLRNEGSYLGLLWYLLNPLLTFTLLFFVFTDKLGQNISYYPLYLLLGIIIFNFFRQATIESTRVIHAHKSLIKSINFPNYTLINAIVLKTLFSHIFEIIIFTVFLLLFDVPIFGIIFYPLILFFFCIFTIGISFILSSLTVYFMDLENIWIFVSQLIWFGTPIFYAIDNQEKLLIFNLFNPLYYFITVSRDVIIYTQQPELWMVAGLLAYSIFSFLLGLLIFNKLKNKFAEMI